jgi:hypothetical protein
MVVVVKRGAEIGAEMLLQSNIQIPQFHQTAQSQPARVGFFLPAAFFGTGGHLRLKRQAQTPGQWRDGVGGAMTTLRVLWVLEWQGWQQ